MSDPRTRKRTAVALASMLAAAAVVVLIVVLSGDGGDDETAPVATTPPSTGTTDTRDGSGDRSSKDGSGRRSRKRDRNASPPTREREAPRSVRQRTPGSRTQRIVVRDGVPVDGQLRLLYARGDRVRLVVSSNRSDVVRISGLGQEGQVGEGRNARFSFRATKGGLYGVELEQAGTRIAVLAIR